MPNWTDNIITFANKETCAKARKLLNPENRSDVVDFNTIIPMPESLNIESGSKTPVAIIWYRTERGTVEYNTPIDTYCSNNELLDRAKKYDDPDQLYELGRRYCFNIDHYGYPTWYEWCCYNWGVKWNAELAYWDTTSVTFQTPWNPPFPVFAKLAEQLDTVLEIEFTDEGDGRIYECTVTPDCISEPKVIGSMWDDEDDD